MSKTFLLIFIVLTFLFITSCGLPHEHCERDCDQYYLGFYLVCIETTPEKDCSMAVINNMNCRGVCPDWVLIILLIGA